MCGRYFFSDKTADEAEDELKLSKGAFATHAGDVTPGMTAPGIVLYKRQFIEDIVRSDADTVTAQNTFANGIRLRNKSMDEGVAISDLFWGIASRDKKLIINARAESVSEKSMFSESIRNRRCILPAAGFYEWDRDRTKFIFKRADEKPVYLAGFYDLSKNRDSFVILTTSANESMKPVHDRMPVMIDKENVRDYLKDLSAAVEMIKEPMPELDRSCDYEQLSLF